MKLIKYNKTHAIQHADCEIRLAALCLSAVKPSSTNYKPPRPWQLPRMLPQEPSQATRLWRAIQLYPSPARPKHWHEVGRVNWKDLEGRGYHHVDCSQVTQVGSENPHLYKHTQVLAVKTCCTGTWNLVIKLVLLLYIKLLALSLNPHEEYSWPNTTLRNLYPVYMYYSNAPHF